MLPLLIAFLLLVPLTALAQSSPHGVAEYFQTAEDSQNYPDGSIVALTDQGLTLVTAPYSSDMFGVVVSQPSVAWSAVGKAGALPVISSGTARVLVLGELKLGDWVTSSDQAGVGQKAIDPGYALGRVTQIDDQGQVLIDVNPQFVAPESEIESPFSLTGALSAAQSGGRLLSGAGAQVHFSVRYLLAILAFLISLAAAYWIFSRTAVNSINAIGRNPLAKGTIAFTSAINIIAALIVVALGAALGLYIIAL